MPFKITIPKRKDFCWIAFLSFIVLFPNIYLALYGSDFAGAFFLKPVIYFCFSCLLFLVPSLFLKARTFFIVMGIFVLLAPLEIAHIYFNRMPVTTAFIYSIMETNWGESSELLASLKVPIAGLFLFWIFYFYVVLKKIKNTYLILSKKIRLYFAGVFLFVLLAGYATDVFLLKFYKIYPYDLIFRTYQVYRIEKSIRAGNEKLTDFRFNALKEDQLQEKEVYVFVIGETGRYSSYSINGYERETSPLLAQTSNLVSYSDFFSEANLTSSSLPFILTRLEAKNYNRDFMEKSFVDAYKEAGFKTYWIANQSAENSFIRRISKDTDGAYFSNTGSDAADNFDENLWISLDKILSNNDKKVLIVIHTLGSHFRYNFRYPASFEVFKPSLQGSFDYALISVKNKEQFINTYDNSILYTDYFLANTIRKIDNLNAISSLVYVADHGENLFDTNEHIILHGGLNYTEYDFHVPFFVWTSDKYNLQYPAKAENISRNKDLKLNANRIFYSMLDMANITFPGQVLGKSIASDFLQEDSVRYIINTNMEVKVLNY
ncbi:MAG: phosphoethanolamine transferase [Candidatus Symbiothrix sp.]|jgi:glucan phosphoethanolaminetransferase (alkaline phosphatase superfamily)|nr:phosphoethanolamine transferase [Candidatus Symbiothrix sp.]